MILKNLMLQALGTIRFRFLQKSRKKISCLWFQAVMQCSFFKSTGLELNYFPSDINRLTLPRVLTQSAVGDKWGLKLSQFFYCTKISWILGCMSLTFLSKHGRFSFHLFSLQLLEFFKGAWLIIKGLNFIRFNSSKYLDHRWGDNDS